MKNNLDDIVFENRNKAYGAYFLRKNYNYYLTKSLVIVLVSMMVISLLAFTFGSKKEIMSLIPQKSDHVVTINFTPDAPLELKQKTKLKLKTALYVAPNVIKDNPKIPDFTIATQTELTDAQPGTSNTDGDPITNNPIVIPVSPPDPPTISDPKPKEEVLSFSEVKPEFPGGYEGMGKFLASSLVYPLSAQRNNIEGRVIIQFVVEKDGQISQAKVLKGIGFGCDEAALKVVNAMPKWKAAMQNGNAVRVYLTLPIVFKLN